jgi:hypothetical protein
MECPCLSECKGRKVCREMLAKGIDEEVSDFDIDHYCEGNPFNCYFFRMLEREEADQPGKKLMEKLEDSLQQPERIHKLVNIRHISTQV